MSRVGELYALQEIDSELDGDRVALDEAESAMGETDELLSSRADVEALQERVEEVRKRLKSAEWEVDEVSAKIAPVEKKLYDGSVRNPKELAGMEEDVRALTSRKRKLEDAVLDVMAEIEEVETALRDARKTLERVQGDWQAEQTRLREQAGTLRGAITGLESRRREQSARVDPAALRLYEGLRAAHQGRAVARVERGMCSGCRISLPMGLLQKARGSGDELVQCTSCERVLYVS